MRPTPKEGSITDGITSTTGDGVGVGEAGGKGGRREERIEASKEGRKRARESEGKEGRRDRGTERWR